MIIEKQSIQEITPVMYDLVSIKKFIEQCGRVCYRSENITTPTSYNNFYDNAIKNKHLSILEHGTVYLTIRNAYITGFEIYLFYKDNKYSKVIMKGDDAFITTNVRVIVENNRYEDLKFMVTEPSYHAIRRTIQMRTSIQVYKELTRHRPISACVESTRFCNYASNKFDNNIRFLIPYWFKSNVEDNVVIDTAKVEDIKDSLEHEEYIYLSQLLEAEDTYNIISEKYGPQAAAGILPQNTTADVVITCFIDEWNHIFECRAFGETGTPHPDTKNLMTSVYNAYFKR